MIIGYQVQDEHGNNWGNRPSYHILTEQAATRDLHQSREELSANFVMVAILNGDIEQPTFECELASTTDQYKTIGISTCHLSMDDHNALTCLSSDPDCNMICSRDCTGWIVKLYDEAERNTGYEGMSDHFHSMLVSVRKAGYRSIEFDCDAQIYDCFETLS